MAPRILSHNDYTVAWICALPLETGAAKVMLDEVHASLPQPETDHNVYALGTVSSHNVVIACLPLGVYGTISASNVVSHMVSTYPNIRFGLMVGIGGGVPSKTADIRLGDVVVSKPTATSGGVIQYDYGKTLSGGHFQRTGSLNKPPPILLKAVAQLESDYMTGKNIVGKIIGDALQKEEIRRKFSRPECDWLFQSTYDHWGKEANCSACDQKQLIDRPPRTAAEPYIHYGLIASGDQVIKDARTRDFVVRNEDILCFEMEAAGLMDELPSLAIRGICDYCDSHKNKQWQEYAALAAAAYTKALLSQVPTSYSGKELGASKESVWMVPFRKNSRFVGREEEIIKIEGLIMQQDSPGRIAICGLGGVGKTQIALELANRMRNRDPECSVLWISCTSYEGVEQAYMSIALKLEITDPKPAEVKQQVKVYLSQDSMARWLLIFDNADDIGMWTMADFLPESERGHILFTTRSRQIAVRLASSNVITISEPDTETAVEILRKSLIKRELLNDREAAISLIRELAYLPLAITQAAAYINEKDIRLSEYTTLLHQNESDVIELLCEDFGDEGRYKDIRNPVATTWWVSFQQIQRLNQTAMDYLLFMACINPRHIPRSLLPQTISEKKRIDAIGLLKAFSFVNEEGGDCSLNLHRLVHLATRNWMRKHRQFNQQILKTADRLSEAFPDDDHTNRKLWREYLPHVLSLIGEIEFQQAQERYVDMLQGIGDSLYSDGRYKAAEELFLRVLTIRKQVLGPKHPVTLISLAEVASTYLSQGRWKDAEKVLEQVIEVYKQVLGPEHPSTLRSMSCLATIYGNQRRWKEAEELLAQVMEVYKQVLGPEHPRILWSMGRLATIYRNQRRWKEAEELNVEVMRIQKQVLGPEHPQTLLSMAELAWTYWDLGLQKEAEELQLQVTEMQKKVLGPEHPSTLRSMSCLATIYGNQRRWKEAEELLAQVMEVYKQVLGPEHPRILLNMGCLATTYGNQRRWKEAEELNVEVMRIQKQVLGPEHPQTLLSMAELALVYWHQGRQREAEELGVQVTEMQKTVLGPEHPHTLITMFNLAFIWKSQGKIQAVSALLEQCLAIQKKVLGPGHPVTLASSILREMTKEDRSFSDDRPLRPD
jgi:tetratricopeptide (TPR) repeat protein/nucleoside phosphorylase